MVLLLISLVVWRRAPWKTGLIEDRPGKG